MLTITGPVNPFCGSSETVKGEVVPPTCVEAEEGETEILKSAMGGGGGDKKVPHPLRKQKLQIAIRRNGDLLMAPPRICIPHAWGN
jgi:hypothetical protein